MEFSYEGIGQVTATFAAGKDIEPGMAVAITANGTVGLGADGGKLCGVVLTAHNGMAAVQIGGMVEVAYTGTAPTVGWSALALNGAGAVKTASGGVSCLVAAVDTVGGTAVIKL